MVQNNMHYIKYNGKGGPEVITLCEGPIPEPAAHEVLIKVSAAGVNRPDILQRLGYYPAPAGASEVPGLEVAGEIIALGAAIRHRQLGEHVCALLAGGGYAEYAVADEALCLPIPNNYSLSEAAGLPEAYFTVWSTVFACGQLQAGERFLVHGGASGIGTAAIQLARARGATVFATAGSEQKVQLCQRLGAEYAINYREQDFVAAIQQATEGHGVDMILDMVGGSYLPRNIEVAATAARIVSIAFLQGAKAEVNISKIMQKRLVLTGATLRHRSLAFKAELASALRESVWPLLDSGRIQPLVSATFPLADAYLAHQHMESGKHYGKLVLLM